MLCQKQIWQALELLLCLFQIQMWTHAGLEFPLRPEDIKYKKITQRKPIDKFTYANWKHCFFKLNTILKKKKTTWIFFFFLIKHEHCCYYYKSTCIIYSTTTMTTVSTLHHMANMYCTATITTTKYSTEITTMCCSSNHTTASMPLWPPPPSNNQGSISCIDGTPVGLTHNPHHLFETMLTQAIPNQVNTYYNQTIDEKHFQMSNN